MPHTLSNSEITNMIDRLEFNWTYSNNKLSLDFKAKNFEEAVWVINEVARAAEELRHHPDFTLRNYNQLRFELSTHSESGVTDKDFELAEKIEGVITRIKN